jgi:putative transposase
MDFAYRFRLNPTPSQQERLAWTLDTCRQVRNHCLHRMNRVENPTYTPEQNRLPDLKEWWTEPSGCQLESPSDGRPTALHRPL